MFTQPHLNARGFETVMQIKGLHQDGGEDFGRGPFEQKFRNFQSRIEWNSLFRKFWSTSRSCTSMAFARYFEKCVNFLDICNWVFLYFGRNGTPFLKYD